jgi:hypothetical protein
MVQHQQSVRRGQTAEGEPAVASYDMGAGSLEWGLRAAARLLRGITARADRGGEARGGGPVRGERGLVDGLCL